MKIDFVDLAKYCQTEYKESINRNKGEKYDKTLFVAIREDDTISVSSTPHILSDANKCILIHGKWEVAIKNWYLWYCVQFINESGEVLTNRIDDEFEMEISPIGGWANQCLCLSADNRIYYSCSAPWENSIKSVWELYLRLKKADTEYERKLISSLFKKDEKILELEKKSQNFEYKTQLLEKENDLYKGILDEIKCLMEQK